MTTNNVILEVNDLVVEFTVRKRILTAIRNISLKLHEGEILALVGESGSGKSVLTKTFTGMLENNGRIASGDILYRGQDLTKLTNNEDWLKIRGSKIATIFQDPMTSLSPIKTIGAQIVEVITKHQKVSRKEAKIKRLTICVRLVFLTLKNALMITRLNIQVVCANASLLRLLWRVVLIFWYVMSQPPLLMLPFKRKSLTC